MRILLFRGVCDTGGVSTWMLSLERELRLRGVQCDFFFGQGSSRLAEFERVAKTSVGPVEALLDVVATNRYDVIHIGTTDPDAEVLSLAHVVPRIVATNHGSPSAVWNSSNCHARTAVSHDMAMLDQRHTDIEVETVFNGVDGDHFSPGPQPLSSDQSKPILAWIGRTTSIEQKDFPRFLRVGTLLRERGVRLWVADAHGADPQFFTQRGYTLPVLERWARVEYNDMPQFYRDVAASRGAVLMTSPMEGFGLAAAEAAACGLTTVGPDVLGLRELIVPDVTGARFALDASDEEVADAVVRWLSSWTPERAEIASQNSRERFAAGKMAQLYIDIYSRLEVRLVSAEVRAAAVQRQLPERTVRIVNDAQRRLFGARIFALTTAAVRLSALGQRRLALRIIAYMWEVMPRAFRHRSPVLRMLRALLNVANPFASRASIPPNNS